MTPNDELGLAVLNCPLPVRPSWVTFGELTVGGLLLRILEESIISPWTPDKWDAFDSSWMPTIEEAFREADLLDTYVEGLTSPEEYRERARAAILVAIRALRYGPHHWCPPGTPEDV